MLVLSRSRSQRCRLQLEPVPFILSASSFMVHCSIALHAADRLLQGGTACCY